MCVRACSWNTKNGIWTSFYVFLLQNRQKRNRIHWKIFFRFFCWTKSRKMLLVERHISCCVSFYRSYFRVYDFGESCSLHFMRDTAKVSCTDRWVFITTDEKHKEMQYDRRARRKCSMSNAIQWTSRLSSEIQDDFFLFLNTKRLFGWSISTFFFVLLSSLACAQSSRCTRWIGLTRWTSKYRRTNNKTANNEVWNDLPSHRLTRSNWRAKLNSEYQFLLAWCEHGKHSLRTAVQWDASLWLMR